MHGDTGASARARPHACRGYASVTSLGTGRLLLAAWLLAAAVPPAAIASASAGQGEIVGRKGKGKAAVSSAGDHDGVTHFDAAASKTVQALVEAFGFPMAQAVTAVDAIRDKGDVNLAVQWLIDEGRVDGYVRMHARTRTRMCDTPNSPNAP